MKSSKCDPRVCEICGKVFIPKRSDQRCCLDTECRKALQRQTQREYRERNYVRVLENNRRTMRERRERERNRRNPKKDTIVAIGYAERQMEATLRLAGKVNTDL